MKTIARNSLAGCLESPISQIERFNVTSTYLPNLVLIARALLIIKDTTDKEDLLEKYPIY